MFPAERLNKIKEILIEEKQLDITTLSQMLHVTEVTMRRDLEKLENENFLTRTHGGAVINEEQSIAKARNVFNENDPKADQHQTIGEIAKCFINDGDVIFLGAGTISRYIARALKGKSRISAVTTDLLVAMDIAIYLPEVKVIFPGGDLNPHNFQLYGRFTEQSIKNLYYNIAFINVDGVSIQRGYTVDDIDKAYIGNDVMSVSKKVIAVCDDSSFDQISFAPLGPIETFNTIISSEQTPEKYKEYFFKNGIQFFCTFDVYRRSEE